MYIYSFWLKASLFRYLYQNTIFQDKKFNSDITGSNIFKTNILSIFLIIFTITLGYPHTIVMYLKLYINSLYIEGDINFQSIQNITSINSQSGFENVIDATEIIKDILDE
jgi:hypothetical protein